MFIFFLCFGCQETCWLSSIAIVVNASLKHFSSNVGPFIAVIKVRRFTFQIYNWKAHLDKNKARQSKIEIKEMIKNMCQGYWTKGWKQTTSYISNKIFFSAWAPKKIQLKAPLRDATKILKRSQMIFLSPFPTFSSLQHSQIFLSS